MSFQPFQVPCSVYNFIDAGLQKQNREKGGDENLKQDDVTGHGQILPRSVRKDRQSIFSRTLDKRFELSNRIHGHAGARRVLTEGGTLRFTNVRVLVGSISRGARRGTLLGMARVAAMEPQESD